MSSDEAGVYRDIRYWVEGRVGRIELHRPRSLNAWTPGMGMELLDAVRRASADDKVGSVLVTGAGRSFCAGADVKVPRELTPDGVPDLSTRLRTIYNPIVTSIRESPKPFVGAIHGASAGLGVSLALSCDLLIAAEDAYLTLAFAKIAVMPDGGSTAFLAERIGLARSAELCTLGERLYAPQALDWGLVNAIFPATELGSAAVQMATRLAQLDPERLAQIKWLLGAATGRALGDQLELEATLQQRHGSTFDYDEGRKAFGQKRASRFQGR